MTSYLLIRRLFNVNNEFVGFACVSSERQGEFAKEYVQVVQDCLNGVEVYRGVPHPNGGWQAGAQVYPVLVTQGDGVQSNNISSLGQGAWGDAPVVY